MQGQRSSVESFPETFELFDYRSGLSNITGMDQDICWNDMLLTPGEVQHYLLSPGDENITYADMSTQENADLSGWRSGGPSSSDHSINQGNPDEAKVEHGWSASVAANARGGVRILEERGEAASMLSQENVNINLNSSGVNDEQSFLQNSNLSGGPQIPEHGAAHVGIRGEDSESGMFTTPYNPGFLGSTDIPSSSNSSGSSSGFVEITSEDSDGRPGSSRDGLRLGCKRKIIEGIPGSSSASGSTSFFCPSEDNLGHSVADGHNAIAGINISSPSCYQSGASSSEEQPNPRFGPITRIASDPPASVTGNAENSQRNFRPRISPAHQNDIFPSNSFSSTSTILHSSSIWLSNDPSPQLPFDEGLESRPTPARSNSQIHSQTPVIPGAPQHMQPLPWDLTPSSGDGSSSSPVNLGDRLGDRLRSMREDANIRSMTRSSANEQPLFVPTTVMRHLVQDSANRNRSSRLIGNTAPSSESGAGISSAVRSSGGLTWPPHQNPPAQVPRSLSEAVRRTRLPSFGSESEDQSNNITLQRSVRSPTSQEIVNQSGSSSRGSQQPIIRSSLLMDRQSDGAPLSIRSMAAREGRSRMLSEIRNALDLMRRGGDLRLEDVFMLDPSVFRGATDLHDRHRDMRLDVDNMSYEELLALEEQIGDVSTGLNEERVLKCLIQRKHSSITVTISSELEPCCICQEDYREGEDLGALDCGHDFHAACIKQWLMHKNLCPICKKTALGT